MAGRLVKTKIFRAAALEVSGREPGAIREHQVAVQGIILPPNASIKHTHKVHKVRLSEFGINLLGHTGERSHR